MFTLAIVALLSTGLEYNMQHFTDKKSCLEAGNAIIQAYRYVESTSTVVGACREVHWL